MNAVNAMREDNILHIGEAVGSGDMPPQMGRTQLERLGKQNWQAADDICFALDYGDREECDPCLGTGSVDAPFSGSDPCCDECGGQGSVYVG